MSTRTLLNLALAVLTTLLIAVIWMRPGLEPDIPADAFQVHTILSLLQATSVRSYPVDAIDLSGPGLDPPGASIMFNGTWIAIGDIDPIDSLRYVRTDTTIHLVADRYQHLLNAGYNNFVRRRLLPGADAINTLIANWQRASALFIRRFQAGDYSETVSLTLSGRSEPVVFTVVARTPDLVLARPEWGIQYHLPADTGQALLSLPSVPDIGQEAYPWLPVRW